MIKRTAMLGLAALLAGCGKPAVDERNATAGEVAEAVSKAKGELKFVPGRWESVVTMVAMEAPGMPPEVSKAMQGTLNKAHRSATCLTKEKAERPSSDFFAKDAKNCTYDHFTLGGGKIDAKMRCGEGTSAVAMAMLGTYDARHYDMAMETRVSTGAQGPMTMKMKIAASHVGDCRGDEDGGS